MKIMKSKYDGLIILAFCHHNASAYTGFWFETGKINHPPYSKNISAHKWLIKAFDTVLEEKC